MMAGESGNRGEPKFIPRGIGERKCVGFPGERVPRVPRDSPIARCSLGKEINYVILNLPVSMKENSIQQELSIQFGFVLHTYNLKGSLENTFIFHTQLISSA